MRIIERTSATLAALALAALTGCGSGVATPKLDSIADFQARTIACIRTVEDQVSTGEAKAKDVHALILSLNQLIARTVFEKTISQAQVAQVQAFTSDLSQKAEGVTKPPADFKAGPAETGSCGIDRDTLKSMLPRIREAVAALK